ncbi:hypothetical protein [uncultured Campylobacter sp.]|uniref:hypothetical protein n=1 Tax=uncultured Campylobacter sp. TaxID=218934 RepID=UPI002634B242|nr:hypothetical protein [uncultured Campylobacter sp.]
MGKNKFSAAKGALLLHGSGEGRKCAAFCMAHKQAQTSLIAKARFLEFHVS